MNPNLPAPADLPPSVSPSLDGAIDAALARIPPLWPLGRFVAVNPYLGFADRPFPEACALLHRNTGAGPLLSAAEYSALFANREIEVADLPASDRDGRDETSLAEELLAESRRKHRPAPSLASHLDQQERRPHWEPFLAEEITKWCGTYCDENQTTWRSPWVGGGLWSGWREAARHDLNPEIFGVRGFRDTITALPADPDAVIAAAVETLRPQEEDAVDFLHAALAPCHGWAGYLQFLVREDALRNRPNRLLREFLAIRLAWEVALLRSRQDPDRVLADWHRARRAATAPDFRLLAAWQQAYERGYQRRLLGQLTAQNPGTPAQPAIQAVFCIDVRSEVIRRHLEAADPGCATLGFAGFFGFAVEHRPADGAPAGARCPVLLVPGIATADDAGPSGSRKDRAAWIAFQNSAASCFGFVETAGIGFVPVLARSVFRREPPACHRSAPRLESSGSGNGLVALAATAAAALRNLGLTRDFARLVLMCGHGAASANNPHASSLDCGACGGFSGDINARLAAMVLNDPAVRQQLRDDGIDIPAATWFVAGLHNTTTDEVEIFDADRLPSGHRADLTRLRAALDQAGEAARRERAPALGIEPDAPGLLGRLQRRSADISEVIPEWGLANNAAIIIAPRARTAGLNLAGRAFLHEYDARRDPTGAVLELILSAPVVVASWINLQYYASRISPQTHGSGNKALHQVFGGIGVVEGNGGDLRCGLSRQSLHDGRSFRHEPRRLSVVVEAPIGRITALLEKLPGVRPLFDHGWIHLLALEGSAGFVYRGGGRWEPFAPSQAGRESVS
jgi:uncharacterized protein YbcC (UPF0753/DUF2309 family)